MIVVGLMGGLGNQMFQYAAARSLAAAYKTSLRIDPSRFEKLTQNKGHTFQLESFKITAERASREEIRRFGLKRSLGDLLAGMVRRKTDEGERLVFEEPTGSEFKPAVLELGPDRYLLGYFNSYKYFSAIHDVLLAEFVPKSLSREALSILQRIEGTNSVSIHLRRGDYVDDPNVYQSIAGILTERYYENAVNFMLSRLERPHFFVFSNDMPWVVKNFKVPDPVTYVDINSPQRGFEDLWMMSRCLHNITAGGSTFSWWAAYLNQNPDKIVIRTEEISNEPIYNHPADYFPPEWESVAS